MKKRIVLGLLLGIAAGIIDVIPMIFQNLTWDANISAFSLWTICGLLISITQININPVIKGLLISFSVLTPCAILIAWKEPYSLIPILIMTSALGSLLGFTIDKFTKEKK